ncbi:hypothetical protein AB205_0051090, partial [Aquarana catesbeiana]
LDLLVEETPGGQLQDSSSKASSIRRRRRVHSRSHADHLTKHSSQHHPGEAGLDTPQEITECSMGPLDISRLHSSTVGPGDEYHKNHLGPGLKGILQDSISTLEQLKNSLLLLQKTFDLMNTTKGEGNSGS